jgi:hypothetical protein
MVRGNYIVTDTSLPFQQEESEVLKNCQWTNTSGSLAEDQPPDLFALALYFALQRI